MRKLENKLKDKGYTIIPLRVFLSEKGLIKMEIGLARGKKLYDKRETIKDRDTQREIKRLSEIITRLLKTAFFRSRSPK